MKNKNVMLLVIAACGLTVLTAQEMPPAQVKVVNATERLMSPTMDVSGSVISENDAEISAQVSAEIIWMQPIGAQLSAGDVIVKLDPERYEIALTRAQALIGKLSADLDFRSQEVERFKTLAARDGASKARFQEELAKKLILEHEIKDAKAQLQNAHKNLALTQLKAPFNGILVARMLDVGEYVSEGESIVRFVQIDRLEIRAFVPLSSLPFLQQGQTLKVSINNIDHMALIKSIVAVSDDKSRMIELRLDGLNRHTVIGSPATVSVPKQQPQTTVAIPRDTLVIKGDQLVVYRIGADNTAEQIQAKLKAIDGDFVAIEANLNPNDRIVIRGGERLMPGQSVQIME